MRKILYLLLLLLVCYSSVYSQDLIVNEGDWIIKLNKGTKKLNIEFRTQSILMDAYATTVYNLPDNTKDILLNSFDASSVKLSKKDITDTFGNGREYTFEYDYTDGIVLEQRFFFYDEVSYFLNEIVLKNENDKISTNYLAPLKSETQSAFLANDDSNRMLWMPFSNEGWIRYQSYELNKEMISHEASAIFNGKSRFGLIVGAIEHDVWKNGVEVNASNKANIDKFSCFSGYTASTSHDILPHGKVTGKDVKSAKFMFGCFDDWRLGMDEFGHANTLIAPPLTWDAGTPFGWSSWGSMMDKISYTGVLDVAQFMKDELMSRGFHDTEGKTVLSLDAFAGDNIAEYNLGLFPKKCEANNQIAGIYYGPFCDWNRNPERIVEGSDGQYKYKDIWLYVNGEPHSQGGICLDPTHPGTKMAMKYKLEQYKKWGYKYMKVDFLLNGIIEGDSYYNPEVTTGVQAYNEGMKYMADLVGEDMYIVLAISPLFPYQYAQGRRVGCDSFSEIHETEYTMNATSYGWWTNKLYQVNDPDHLVMMSSGTETYGVNRARVTSGAITGAFIFGDNFSDKVQKGFPEESRARALLFMTNEDINDIPRTCKSFMPVEGYIAKEGGAENLMMYHTDRYTYLSAINYSSTKALAASISFGRLGINTDNVESVKELWTGSTITVNNGGFTYAVSPKDARVYRIEKKGTVGVEDELLENDKNIYAKVTRIGSLLMINSYEEMKCISLFDSKGRILHEQGRISVFDHEINLNSFSQGMYVLNIVFSNGQVQTHKLIVD